MLSRTPFTKINVQIKCVLNIKKTYSVLALQWAHRPHLSPPWHPDPSPMGNSDFPDGNSFYFRRSVLPDLLSSAPNSKTSYPFPSK